MLSRDEIIANVAAVNARIDAACARAGRKRDEVTLVAVSKTFSAEAVEHAIAAGVTDVGENRVQEAREKRPLVGDAARWHLIGHLQSNKAKDAVRVFDMIETIDSASLAEKVARAAESIGKKQEVLLQINVGGEEQKSGADPRDAESIMKAIASMDSLLLRGVMTIPPADDDPRRWFRETRAIRDHLGLKELSMGMSEDYEIAIEEGSTLVRVGRAIFGSRG
jgi:pyridoxal phosphate enzyme (YggS family)